MTTVSPLRLIPLSLVLLGLAGASAPGSNGERLTSRPRPAAPEVKPLPVGEEVRTGTGQKRRAVLPDGSILYVNQQTKLKITARRGLKLDSGEVFVDAAPGKERFVLVTPQREIKGLAAAFAVRTTDAGTGVVVTRGKTEVVNPADAETIALNAGLRLDADGKPTPAPRASHLLDWTRDLMIAAESPLIPASSHNGGSLTIVDPNGQEAKLSMRRYHVDVHIEDGFARTTTDQTYFNDTHGRLEGTFQFPLPPDASLSRLAMYVDGTRMEGGMVERDYGRNVYETIVTKQQDPALLEWVDGSTFKMRVFPLEARQEKRIVLSYSQRLGSLYGEESYRFPAGHTLDSVRDWSMNVRLKNGKALDWSSSSHTLRPEQDAGDRVLKASEKNAKLDRDFVLSLGQRKATEAARFSTMEQDGERYLMVRYRPELPQRGGAGREPRDWVFLFESSGEREPLLARAQVEIVRGLLQNADVNDRFAVLSVGTRVRSPMKECEPVTPENIDKALTFLEGSHLIGALDLDKGLSEAVALLKEGRNPHLVHVGSGVAAMGEQRADVLVKRIPDDVCYVGIGVGRRWNRSLMKTAAEKTGGLFTQINPDEPISWRSFELASILSAPRLLDVSVSDEGGKNRYLTCSSLLTQGEEVCAVARLTGNTLPEKLTIRGRCAGKNVEYALVVNEMAKEAGYLPRTWAKLEIDRLLAEDSAKHKERIVELSKGQYVMSPFTSLLVLENEAMYQQYKVDRGRKDHWALYPCPEKIEVYAEDDVGNRIDPKKTARPSGKQVLQTIVTRSTSQGLLQPQQVMTARALAEVSSGKNAAQLMKQFTSYYKQGKYKEAEMYAKLANELDPDNPVATAAVTLARTQSRLASDSSRKMHHEEFFYRSLQDISVEGLLPGQGKPDEVGRVLPQGDLAGVPITRGNTKMDDAALLRKLLPILNSPNEKMDELLVNSENEGQIKANWTRFWATDQPSHLTFDRIHGSIDGIHDVQEVARSSALLYRRPTFSGNDSLFYDLVSYAPGMNTSVADVLAVIEAEAAPSPASKAGKIDDEARKLFDKASQTGWRAFTLPAEGDEPALTITFDGQGRYVFEGTVFPGFRERVVCDGDNLWHLYPDLHIGAKRKLSRFHRQEFSRLVPMALPHAEDLARGADLVMAGERTVAVVPHGIDSLKDAKGKPLSYTRLHLIFDEQGRLSEQQVIEMPAKTVLTRILLNKDGGIRILDTQNKEMFSRKTTLADAKTPDLKPDLKGLVVLPLPYRTREHIIETRKLKYRRNEDLPFADATALFAADFAAGNSENLLKLFRESFHGRDQRQLGLYVLLAAAGQNLDGQNLDVLSEHRDEPLAQYLALHSSPVLRQHASQWAVGSVQWGDGALRHLAVTHAILQRWQNAKVLDGNKRQRQDALSAALDYAEKHKNTHFGFALLGLMTDRAAEATQANKDAKDVRDALARLWQHNLKTPGLQTVAQYEQARALFRAGQRDEARKAWIALYESERKQDRLLAIDDDFHKALLGDGKTRDEWNTVIRRTARELIDKKQRPAVLALARQCWQLDDQPLAQDLMALALDGIKERKERLLLTVDAIEFLNTNGQEIEAERLLQPLLDDAEWSKQANLWRLACSVAGSREQSARRLECLERALDAEYRDRPEVMRQDTIDKEYRTVLAHLQDLGEAMVTLKVKPPEDFLARVVRTADRWRSLSKNGNSACETAARILRQLDAQELAWDYLTTPVGQKPGESAPWVSLAQTLRNQGDLKTADQAFASAIAAEPTNAQILWDRAQNLRQSGNAVESKKLLRQLAESTWQPRFSALAAQARWQLEKR